MARDILADLTEEWYSESETQPETIEEEVDDEFLALEVLLRARGTVVSGDASVNVTEKNKDETS